MNGNNEAAIEAEIKAKGLSAPRLTPADIDATIVSEHYFTAAQGHRQAIEDATDDAGGCIPSHTNPGALSLLTFCVLVLRNGFTVTGESACASPENFNVEIGRKIARDNARGKIWLLEGYLLRTRLHEAAEYDAKLRNDGVY